MPADERTPFSQGMLKKGTAAAWPVWSSAGSGEMLISWDAALWFSVKKQELRCLSSGLRRSCWQLALDSGTHERPSQAGLVIELQGWRHSPSADILQPLQRGSQVTDPGAYSVLLQQEVVFGKGPQKPKLPVQKQGWSHSALLKLQSYFEPLGGAAAQSTAYKKA